MTRPVRLEHHLRIDRENGFSLIETMVAMAILAFCLLSLAQVLAAGMTYMTSSSLAIVAREKAREAIESVHTARDTRVITWAQIRNVVGGAGGGIFLDGARPLLVVGPDGLINTADDGPGLEIVVTPGPDNILGTPDDTSMPLVGYTREIQIRDIPGTTTLRQLRIIMRFPVAGQPAPATCVQVDGTPITQPGCYVLTTFVSSFS
jgi:prepilin-type N-terminal cleavage/methylation domain-containing protein